MNKQKKHNWDTYRNLEKFNFDIYISKKKEKVDISKRNFASIIGILLITIGITSLILSFAYLMLIDSFSVDNITFNPIIHRIMISCGILLPLIGLNIKSKNKYVKILIDIKNRRLEIKMLDNEKKVIENIKISSDFKFSVVHNADSILVNYNDANHSLTILTLKNRKRTSANDIAEKLTSQLNNTFTTTL